MRPSDDRESKEFATDRREFNAFQTGEQRSNAPSRAFHRPRKLAKINDFAGCGGKRIRPVK
jgi:hypothetical protein